MTPQEPPTAGSALEEARKALREKRTAEARTWAEQAARLDPHLEDAWLILAAFSPPQDSIAYLKKALAINPNSERARQGMHWAAQRMRTGRAPEHITHPMKTVPVAASAGPTMPVNALTAPHFAVVPSAVVPPASFPSAARVVRRRASPLDVQGLLLWAAAGLLVLTAVLYFWIIPFGPILTARYSSAQRPVDILFKPSLTPTSTVTRTPTATATFTSTPTLTPTDTPLPTETPTRTPKPTRTPRPTNTEAPPEPPPPAAEIPPSGGEHWVDVNLSDQTAAAYDGDQPVANFVVSTGTSLHPTVTGEFHIYVKYRYADMSGPGYYLPNVPYVMYFYQGYGLHGTYWHHNFGTPMSHGCVNFSIEDAGWLYDFVDVGTLVNVHY